ncbi:hypothetical protein WR25_14678 [Diploscapter pachys]|uniref:Helicase ATP-binding domain-containing protein n=1 Tax=Diploscapter pachys TaxID=2018661 RepID=A0A2A2KAR7_9BILA|nr:hypothetical protein WR25_14678 [Diploscapter pachys]
MIENFQQRLQAAMANGGMSLTTLYRMMNMRQNLTMDCDSEETTSSEDKQVSSEEDTEAEKKVEEVEEETEPIPTATSAASTSAMSEVEIKPSIVPPGHGGRNGRREQRRAWQKRDRQVQQKEEEKATSGTSLDEYETETDKSPQNSADRSASALSNSGSDEYETSGDETTATSSSSSSDAKDRIYKFPMRYTKDHIREHFEYCESEPPPNFILDKDFKTGTSIFSTENVRFDFPRIPYLRRQKIQENYANVNEYLDILGRLEHEEFDRPLREMIQLYRASKTRPEKRHGIRVAAVKFFQGSRDDPNNSNTSWDRPKRIKYDTLAFELIEQTLEINPEKDEVELDPFIYGQTILISDKDFYDSPIVAQIGGKVWKPSDRHRASGSEVKLPIGSDQDREQLVNASDNQFFIMEPTSIFFFPTRVTFDVIKNMLNDKNTWPKQFEQYMLRAETVKMPWTAMGEMVADFHKDKISLFEDEFDFDLSWEDKFYKSDSIKADQSQRRALATALKNTLTLIQGPPGTGKTYLSVAYVMAMLSLNLDRPVIVSSMKNLTLDQMINRIEEKLLQTGMKPEVCICRLGFKVTSEEIYDKYTLQDEDRTKLWRAKVIFATSTGIAIHRSKLLSVNPIALVMDEAAELTEAQTITCFLPCLEQIVLVGDHQQLRPRPNVQDHELFGMNISFFERLVIKGFDVQVLTMQHRMNNNIVDTIVRPYFYKMLESHESVRSYPIPPGMKTNLFFWNTNSPSYSRHGSFVNKADAIRIFGLVSYMLRVDGALQPEDITVICMYKAQLRFIRRLFRDHGNLKVRVETVDGYQGKENKVIIVSIARSNTKSIGFLALINRSIVALTRAQHGMYVVGNFSFLSRHSAEWKAIYESALNADFAGDALPLICRTHLHEMKVKKPEELRLSEVNQTANCLCVLVEKPTQEAETGPKSLYFNYGRHLDPLYRNSASSSGSTQIGQNQTEMKGVEYEEQRSSHDYSQRSGHGQGQGWRGNAQSFPSRNVVFVSWPVTVSL